MPDGGTDGLRLGRVVDAMTRLRLIVLAGLLIGVVSALGGEWWAFAGFIGGTLFGFGLATEEYLSRGDAR